MQTRTSHSHITFRRRFRLSGMDMRALAGRYKVNLEEKRLDSLIAEVWRRTDVTLQVAAAGATDYVNADPQELGDARLRDGDDSIGSTMPAPGARQRDVLRLRLP